MAKDAEVVSEAPSELIVEDEVPEWGADRYISPVVAPGPLGFIKRHMTIFDWLPNYKASFLVGDILGGITLAALLCGEGIAYALLAGIPPQNGLYTSVIPTLMYAFFGTSRHLSVGPVSLTGVMTAVVIDAIGTGDPNEDRHLAHAVSFTTAIMFFLFAFSRLGFMEHMMSKPIIEGFVTGIATTVITGQMPTLIGVNKKEFHFHGHTTWQNAGFFITHYQYGNRYDVGMTILCLTIMFSIKMLKKNPRFWWLKFFPGVLIGTVIAIVFSKTANLESKGVALLKTIPSGFPRPSLPIMSFDLFSQSVPAAFIIAFVGWIESMAVARQLATQHKYEVSNNREFVGLGMSNFVAAFFSGMPVAGSIGRSIASSAAGAKSHLANALCGLFMLGVCYATSLFYHFPRSAVACIIVFCVSALIEIWAIPDMIRQKQRGDLLFFTIGYFLTFLLGIEQGLITSAIISAVFVIRKGTIPTPVFMGRVPNTRIYKPLDPKSDAKPVDGIMIIQPGTSLFFFANAMHFNQCITPFISRALQRELPQWLARGETDGVVLDFTNVEVLDFTATEVLVEIAKTSASNCVALGICGLRKSLLESVKKSHIIHYMDRSFLGVTAAEVVHNIEKKIGNASTHRELQLNEEKPADDDSDVTKPSESTDED